MRCPNCGMDLAEGATYCGGCGTKLNNVGPAGAQIKKRNIAVCIILSLITCGFYTIYWLICLVNDLKAASDRTEEPSGGVVFLLSLVTCGIYMWVWMYKAGEKVNIIRAKRGAPNMEASLLYLLLAIFGLGIVNYCLIQNELNEVATL